MAKKLTTRIELPNGKYKATKVESNHSNVPKICRGYFGGWEKDYGVIEIGKSFGLSGGDYSGLRTTEVKEIELTTKGVLIKTQNSTYLIEEDSSDERFNGER